MSKRNYLIIEMSIAALLLLILTVTMFPRFTGSQVRSKIALTFQRMQAINKANYAYQSDHGELLIYSFNWFHLTTPIVYLENWESTHDPFKFDHVDENQNSNPTEPYFWNPRILTDGATNEAMRVPFYYHTVHSGSATYLIGSNGSGKEKAYMSMSVGSDGARFTGGYHLSNGLISQGMLLATDSTIFNDF